MNKRLRKISKDVKLYFRQKIWEVLSVVPSTQLSPHFNKMVRFRCCWNPDKAFIAVYAPGRSFTAEWAVRIDPMDVPLSKLERTVENVLEMERKTFYLAWDAQGRHRIDRNDTRTLDSFKEKKVLSSIYNIYVVKYAGKLIETVKKSPHFKVLPFDIFLVHAGPQKTTITDPLVQFFKPEFRAFADYQMETRHGDPREFMRFALSTCRYVVIIISREFLQRRHPCEELTYSETRMQWLRNNMGWESMYVVLFDITLEEYEAATSPFEEELPPIGQNVVLYEFNTQSQRLSSLGTRLKECMIKQDKDKEARSKWACFLDMEARRELPLTFPSPSGLFME